MNTKITSRPPVLLIAIGRQRVGKTVFLNSIYQIFKEKGADIDIWNADAQNKSLSLTSFHKEADTFKPVENVGIQKTWIEERLDRMAVETKKDALLDIGGGMTGLNLLIKELDLAEYAKAMNIQLTIAYLIGPDAADLDFLKELQDLGSVLPSSTMVIFNEALISEYVSLKDYFGRAMTNPIIQSILKKGGRATIMPKLIDIEHINARLQLYRDFANNVQIKGFTRTSSIFALRTRKWLDESMPRFLSELPKEWLPRLPEEAIWFSANKKS